jgi:hypothetical protein
MDELDDLFGCDDFESEVGDLEKEKVCTLYTAVKSMQNMGGGRGVFAAADIEPGRLMSAEKPFILWSKVTDFSDVDDLSNVVLQILTSESSLKASRSLHPCLIEDCEASECEDIRKMFSRYDTGDLNKLAVAGKASVEEVIRVALVLQHNGFHSGLYETQSLFNHSCEPNCLKLIPANEHGASEIWTIKEVKAGEELCICYFSPRESSAAVIRQYVEENHRFVCSCTKCCGLGYCKNDSGSGSGSLVVSNEVLSLEGEVETALKQLEESMHALQAGAIKQKTLVEYNRIRTVALDWREKIFAAIGSFGDAVAESVLVPMQARLGRAEVGAVAGCIEGAEQLRQDLGQQQAEAYVQSQLRLLGLQRRYLHRLHPDIGATLSGVVDGAEALRARFPSSPLLTDAVLWGGVVLETTEMKGLTAVSDKDSIISATAVATPAGAAGKGSITGCATNTAAQCIKWCKAEAKLIKSLYFTPARYPATVRLLTGPPGSHYWGCSEDYSPIL